MLWKRSFYVALEITELTAACIAAVRVGGEEEVGDVAAAVDVDGFKAGGRRIVQKVNFVFFPPTIGWWPPPMRRRFFSRVRFCEAFSSPKKDTL
jgi:hypothetical protein